MKRYLTLLLLVLALNVWAQSYPGTNNSLPEGAGEPPNDPPVWNNTPSPVYVEGVAETYDLTADFSDPEGDTITIVNETGCTLPGGITIDDPNDQLDDSGAATAGTTSSCVFSLDDGTNSPVNSSAFSIVVNAMAAAGTIYERDVFGVPRTGTSGGYEVRTTEQPGNPIMSLDWGVPITIGDFGACDATVTTGDGNWAKVNNDANDVVCVDAGDHQGKGTMTITDGGSAGSDLTISAVTLNDPVRVDFTAAHSLTTNDIIFCDDAAGGTWQLHWRYFKVTVVDTDTVDLQGEDGSGVNKQPKWTTYTSGGVCNAITFKVVRHTTALSTHPYLLADGSRAKVDDVWCTGPNIDYIIIWGLSFPDTTTQGSYNRIENCDNFVFAYNDMLTTTEVPSSFVNFLTSADYFVAQDNTITQTVTSGTQEADGFTQWTGSNGSRIVRNEIWNVSGHPIQVQEGGSIEGSVFAGNSFYVTTAAYADSDGTPNPSGTHACAEKAVEFKDAIEGSRETTKSKFVRVEANMMWGFRPTAAACSGGSTNSGAAIGTGVGQQMGSVLAINNISWDMADFLVHTGAAGIDVDWWSVIGNISQDITHSNTTSDWFFHFDPTNTNDFNEFAFNTVNGVDTWLNATSGQSGDFTCNLMVDANGLSGAIGMTQDNNYGYGNTTDLAGGDTDGGAVSNANLASLTVQPFIITAPATTVVIPNILSTASSPHLADCPSVGSASNGISDETVTF